MLQKLSTYLPRGLRQFLKGVISLAASASALPKSKGTDAPSAFDHVSDATRRAIRFDIWRDPDALLQMRKVREQVAYDRAKYFLSHNAVQKVDSKNPQVARGAVEYNLDGARSAPDLDRPMIMVNVASAIEKVRKNIGNLDVLSIGPRSEIELFGLRAAGFSWERIKAIDLFSYSPYVQVGDVHAVPFPDNSFDIVFLGWVLAYSKDQRGAIAEVIRVLRPGGIAVVASDYSSEETHTRAVVDSTHMQTSEQMLALFEDHVRYVFFRHDPDMPNVHMIMVAVEIKKPRSIQN